jgi:hypothetical protein
MSYIATLSNKRVEINLTRRAEIALEQRESPLYVEMELYFSCLIRKALRYHEQGDDAVAVSDKLFISFKPVMSKVCKVEAGKSAPLTTFPIAKVEPYIPKWVLLDYKNGEWCGDFGYADEKAG